MKDTPDVDAVAYDGQPGNPMIPEGRMVVPVEFARQLERERDEARNEAERFRDNAIRISVGGDGTKRITDRFSWEEQLIAERDQLKKWKEEAISVMPPMQEIGEEIGVGFGQTIHDKILPELIRRREAKDRSRERAEAFLRTIGKWEESES